MATRPESVSTDGPTAETSVGGLPGPDRAMTRFAAAAGVLGMVVVVVMGQLHPGKAPPNDSAASFLEYSRSSTWTAVHIGQFTGTLLVSLMLLTLARLGAVRRGAVGVLATVGGFATVLYAAVFAVQMAVDGVALKGAVHRWVTAPDPAAKEAAFLAASAVRDVEKGLSGFFQMLGGTSLLALGLGIAIGRLLPRWLGWVAVLAGAGLVAGGALTAHTGFSSTASAVLLGPSVLLLVFVLGASVPLWRGPAAAPPAS
ncbi:hypothetical protein [Oryzihumus leptocrescens]|uniref:DUF4386 family protein n=1 Tax=Oryzihumus leptocrescens TaxID=297536 RepID=A0A542ZHA2_9MICO|nr:hypothetical protein [Oryzihumus leptocrescens]TQL59733.1 hypothetical protein FB474_1099 [Oryzihumus leptocrescens]